MKNDIQGVYENAAHDGQFPLFWECPKCQTINSEVECEECGFVPEYYLPIDPAELELVDETEESPDNFDRPGIYPLDDEQGNIRSQGKTWKCKRCGKINPDRHPICQNCAAGKPRQKPGVFIGLLVAIGILIFTVVFISNLNPGRKSSPFQGNTAGNQSNPAQSSASIPITDNSRIYPYPPADGCVLWTTVSMADIGKTMCVYGLVSESYTADSNRYFLRFNDEKNSFRMVLMKGLKMESAAGECVYQTDEIKEYKEVLYMEMTSLPMICEQ